MLKLKVLAITALVSLCSFAMAELPPTVIVAFSQLSDGSYCTVEYDGGHEHFHIYTGDAKVPAKSVTYDLAALKVRADQGNGILYLDYSKQTDAGGYPINAKSTSIQFSHASGSGANSKVNYSVSGGINKTGTLTAGETLSINGDDACGRIKK